MRSPYAPGRRRPSGSLVLAVVLVTGAWLVNDGLRTSAPPQPAAGQARAAGGTSGTGGTAAALPRSVPVRVRVPALGVDAPLVRLGLDPAGHLTPPPAGRPREAGWFAGGASPGERGTAVIAGHVDTLAGPAVFYALGAARKGWTVAVDRTDGGTAAFTVDAVAVYAKDRFPDRTVYAAASRPELRLITCGGEFREGSGYSGDVVVFAHLTAVSPTPARDRARTAAGTRIPARARGFMEARIVAGIGTVAGARAPAATRARRRSGG